MNETHPESLIEEEETLDLGELAAGREVTLVPTSPVQNVVRAMDDLKAIRTFIANELKPSEEGKADGDYGSIPGTSEKNVLLLPGAQKVCMYFNVRPVFRVTRAELPGGHLEVYIETDLLDRKTGTIMGAGVGLCSTMESKYRYRKAERLCPDCGKPAIIRGKKFKPTDKETWLCWKKKDGCGRNFDLTDPKITGQEVGQKENENIHDSRNTCLKIGKKRSMIDATIGLGCLSELFTQDIEDFYDLDTKSVPTEPVKPEPAKAETKTEIGASVLNDAKGFETAGDYRTLLAMFKQNENAAHRSGVWNEYTDLKIKAFTALRDKIGGEPLVPVTGDATYWLEFYALDEAYRKGDRNGANKIFFECKDSLANLGPAWMNYANELKKAVTV